MVHGKILALEIYFLLILLIQYNIILIIINFRYIILLFANKQWGTTADTKRYIDFPLTLNTCFFGSIRTGSRFLQERGSWSDVTNNMPYRVTTSPPNSFSIYMEDAEVLVKVSYFLVGK